jgi:hypothetical protein
MKHNLMMVFFALALLLAVSVAPVYAADGDDLPPPSCSQCDDWESPVS